MASPSDESASQPSHSVRDLRRDFGRLSLTEANAGEDPIDLFRRWLDEAIAAGLRDPNAFVLATSGANAQPSGRVLLLKDFSDAGFVFYTNYESRKGQQLAENPRACMIFFWPDHERQVRIEGLVERVSRDESAEYFVSRPRASQLGAHASAQSRTLAGREEIEQKFPDLDRKYDADQPIPLPDYWGGYLLKPELLEFWQGRSNRLHDRLEYRFRVAGGENSWQRQRLSP